MTMIKLSIIIPVYNVEKYLRACLDSVFKQKGDSSDYEVIVVNDGSPDNSQAIIDQYSSIYSNIVVINQNNRGLSAARNAGLRIANGEYVWFVDSDDSITPNAVDYLKKEIEKEKCEVYVFSIIKVLESDGTMHNTNNTFISSKYNKYYNYIADGLFYHRKIPIGISQKNIFLRKFLLDHNLFFTEGIYHEDMEFFIRVLISAKRIKPLNAHLYNYLIRTGGSITTSKISVKHVNDRLKIINLLNEMCNKTVLNSKQIALVNDAAFYMIYGVVFDKRIREEHELSKIVEILRHSILLNTIHSFRYSILYYWSFGKVYKFIKILLKNI